MQDSEHSGVSLDWQSYSFDQLDAGRLYTILQLRQKVFIVEQACVYNDLDGLDQDSMHLCAWHGERLLAYMRCLPPGLDYRESAMGRIVVSPDARGLKLGRELVRRGIQLNQSSWPGSGIRIGAQAYLEDFYRELGFVTDSDVYDEDGIPHIKMVLR
jgi:ElaA protein